MQERLHATWIMLLSIVVVGGVIFCGIILWPYKDAIGSIVMISIVVVTGFGYFELFSLTKHRHYMRAIQRDKASIDANVIEAAGLAIYVDPETGNLYHASAMAENAKTYPVEIEQVTGEVIDEAKRLKEAGSSERVIAGRLNMPRNQVRKLLGKK